MSLAPRTEIGHPVQDLGKYLWDLKVLASVCQVQCVPPRCAGTQLAGGHCPLVFTPGGEGSGGEKAAKPLESAITAVSKPGVSTHGDAGVLHLRFAKTRHKLDGRDAVGRGELPKTSSGPLLLLLPRLVVGNVVCERPLLLLPK